jgi:thiamine biosynthesis lipoprotein
MGTLVTIDLVDQGADPAALDRAFAWFQAIESTCTRFDEESELMRLCAQPGRAVPVSDGLFEAIRFALAVAGDTGGAFDPTVGAAIAARGIDREHRTGRRVRTPDPGDGATYRDVLVDDERRTVTLRRRLTLDLGAVAKGLAVDAAARELQAYADFAIDAGGDLFLGGRNHHGEPWTVGIRHPRLDGELIELLRVSDRAVCTSGNYEKPHLIDPRLPVAAGRDSRDWQSGRAPGNAAVSATVVAPTAMLADALATAAFVLGPRDGISLLERHGVEGIIYDGELARFATPGLPRG